MSYRPSVTDLVIIVPTAVVGLTSLWIGYWPGAALFGGGAVLILLGTWYFDRPRPRERVQFDSVRITRFMRNGKTESIAWDDVYEIIVLTSDQGPGAEDCYWAFSDADEKHGCLVANGADGANALLDHIMKFPRFDHRRFVEAMGSAENAEFIVWRRDAQQTATS